VPKTSAKATDRSTEEAASYALGHRTRVEILSALNEQEYTASDLAGMVRQPLSTVGHHLAELLASRSIEVADVREVGNVEQKVYRAVSTAMYDEEEFARLSFEERQAIYALIVQNSGAEVMASLWSGAISNEAKSWLTWARFYFDRQGWDEAFDVFDHAWRQLQRIQGESTARCAESGEKPDPWLCSLQGYPRSRSARDVARDRRRGTPFDI
jgi:DNA-binding transcriptional ArsR family regulator